MTPPGQWVNQRARRRWAHGWTSSSSFCVGARAGPAAGGCRGCGCCGCCGGCGGCCGGCGGCCVGAVGTAGVVTAPVSPPAGASASVIAVPATCGDVKVRALRSFVSRDTFLGISCRATTFLLSCDKKIFFPTTPPRTIGRKIESSDRAADHTGGPPMSGGHNATFVSLQLGFGAAKSTF